MQASKQGAEAQAEPVEAITVNQFASARMGLSPGLTAVKIDNYTIACVPYRLSLAGAVLLASFSPQELAFFQRFANGLAGLNLVLQPANAQQSIKVFARCMLRSIVPMRGRESIGLISLAWKPCPPDIKTMLEDYLGMLDRLKVEYEDYRGKTIRIDAASAAAMGYGNVAELVYGQAPVKIAVFGLASDRADFLLPKNAPGLAAGTDAALRLLFKPFQFSVNGSIADVAPLPNGACRVGMKLGFSPELVDIIEHYRFHERLTG